MTTICSQVPTLTQVSTVPTATQITTTSESLSSFTTVTTTSIYATSCPVDTTTCFTYLSATSQVTVVQTVTDIVVATIISDGLATVSNTLFGSSCSTISGPAPPSSPTPGGITSPRITPSSVSSTASASAAAAQATGTESEKKFPLGPVIGGAVGGALLIAGLAWLAWKFFHKPPVPKTFSKQDAHNSYYGKEEGCEPQNWGQNNAQPPQQPQPTGTEGQSNTGDTNQNANQKDDYDFDRLPKRAEEKIKEKLDEYLNRPPTSGGGVPAGLAGAAAAAGRPNSGYGPAPSPSPYANAPGHQSQPSYSGSIGGPAPPAPVWSAPSPPPGQYGAPVPGQTTYTQQPPYNPQFPPGQYRGYAPSGPT
ncbi:hypothetical protein M413DRAFT_165832 [Hebeloma cylindrosporum]|uniref:Uncharacterized protein n=1 Tax=Hebeloma cylindrosporum TaxID=76867 RepID=A0A0C3CAP7_HEBCY|nr:hypothetical protein M413DRAFT_165832 [Hebeloma cylindrosporum h7]